MRSIRAKAWFARCWQVMTAPRSWVGGGGEQHPVEAGLGLLDHRGDPGRVDVQRIAQGFSDGQVGAWVGVCDTHPDLSCCSEHVSDITVPVR